MGPVSSHAELGWTKMDGAAADNRTVAIEARNELDVPAHPGTLRARVLQELPNP